MTWLIVIAGLLIIGLFILAIIRGGDPRWHAERQAKRLMKERRLEFHESIVNRRGRK